jgi:hypothetical protein
VEGRLEDRALVIRLDSTSKNRPDGGTLTWKGANTACSPQNTCRVISDVDAVGGQ